MLVSAQTCVKRARHTFDPQRPSFSQIAAKAAQKSRWRCHRGGSIPDFPNVFHCSRGCQSTRNHPSYQFGYDCCSAPTCHKLAIRQGGMLEEDHLHCILAASSRGRTPVCTIVSFSGTIKEFASMQPLIMQLTRRRIHKKAYLKIAKLRVTHWTSESSQQLNAPSSTEWFCR